MERENGDKMIQLKYPIVHDFTTNFSISILHRDRMESQWQHGGAPAINYGCLIVGRNGRLLGQEYFIFYNNLGRPDLGIVMQDLGAKTVFTITPQLPKSAFNIYILAWIDTAVDKTMQDISELSISLGLQQAILLKGSQFNQSKKSCLLGVLNCSEARLFVPHPKVRLRNDDPNEIARRAMRIGIPSVNIDGLESFWESMIVEEETFKSSPSLQAELATSDTMKHVYIKVGLNTGANLVEQVFFTIRGICPDGIIPLISSTEESHNGPHFYFSKSHDGAEILFSIETLRFYNIQQLNVCLHGPSNTLSMTKSFQLKVIDDDFCSNTLSWKPIQDSRPAPSTQTIDFCTINIADTPLLVFHEHQSPEPANTYAPRLAARAPQEHHQASPQRKVSLDKSLEQEIPRKLNQQTRATNDSRRQQKFSRAPNPDTNNIGAFAEQSANAQTPRKPKKIDSIFAAGHNPKTIHFHAAIKPSTVQAYVKNETVATSQQEDGSFLIDEDIAHNQILRVDFHLKQ